MVTTIRTRRITRHNSSNRCSTTRICAELIRKRTRNGTESTTCKRPVEQEQQGCQVPQDMFQGRSWDNLKFQRTDGSRCTLVVVRRMTKTGKRWGMVFGGLFLRVCVCVLRHFNCFLYKSKCAAWLFECLFFMIE